MTSAEKYLDPSTKAVIRQVESVLINGDPEDRDSLLRVIEYLCGPEERMRVEFWAIAARKEQ